VEDLYRRGGAYSITTALLPRSCRIGGGRGVALIGLEVPALRWLYDYAWFVGFSVSGSLYLLLSELGGLVNDIPHYERRSSR